jgi:hypothetical protein
MRTIFCRGRNRISLRILGVVVGLATALLFTPSRAIASSIDIPINAQGTFLRLDSSDSAIDAYAIDLAALGISPGSQLDLLRLGDFAFCSLCDETGLDMIGVFSTSATLLASDELNRVSGAIDMGGFRSFATPVTLFDGQPTDISQDFAISYSTAASNGVSLIVPLGARFLFVSVPDSFYRDNLDTDRNYGVRLTYAPVPEPATVILFGLGMSAMAIRRRATAADAEKRNANCSKRG